jgi:heme/copper-type cytochrome/quinol oxidase subunit 2
MRKGIFLLSLVMTIAMGVLLNQLFFAVDAAVANNNWIPIVIVAAIIAGIVVAAIYFVVQFRKTV